MAARLTAQEEQILLLTKEISTLRDGLCRGLDDVGAVRVSPKLESLRGENEKLRYRLLHLRRGLQAELELEEAQKRQEVKCGKAPGKITSKVQHRNNRADNKVAVMTETANITRLTSLHGGGVGVMLCCTIMSRGPLSSETK